MYRSSLSPAAASNLLVATVIALSAPVAARAQAPDLASAKARTIQVTAVQWGMLPFAQGSQPTPLERLSTARLRYEREGSRARFEELSREKPPKNYTLASLVSDGKTVYELLGVRNQFVKTPLEPAADGSLPMRSGFGGPGLRVALGWKSGALEKFAPAPGETLDGKALAVYTRSYQTTGQNDTTLTHLQKLWVDPKTRLPVRHSAYITSASGTMEISRTEFSDWKLDEPLAPSLFTWKAPEGATEFKPNAGRPPLLTVGTPAPDFTVAKWGGGDLKLSDYKGKVVVLDFWATWCGPCQVSMPHVEKIHQLTKDQGVAVLGVCVWDEKAAYEAWVPKNRERYTFTFGFDPAGRGAENIASKLYHVSGIPTTYVIDRDGKVAAALVGFNPGGDTRLEEALAALGVKVPVDVATGK